MYSAELMFCAVLAFSPSLLSMIFCDPGSNCHSREQKTYEQTKFETNSR